MKKLGEAEFEIMKILWGCQEPATSNQILDGLHNSRDWKLSSLMTALSRLAHKGFVSCDRSTRTNYYTAVITQEEYSLSESRNFLERLYDNSVQKLVASLYHSNSISKEDLEELRAYLDDQEEQA
ncbi:MAG: BlaI/MecI/CopY family transcriptional regulator [Eubacterium sp.]|nr:BlaI/MecI/CopY family transcriptional regulator [Eubacterium sp.]